MNLETINQWSEWWIRFMAYRILDYTLVFVLAGTIWLMARHRVSAQFGYLLFLLVLVKLLTPQWISVPGLVSSWFLEKETAGSNLALGWFDWNFGKGIPSQDNAGSLADRNQTARYADSSRDSALTLPSVLLLTWLAAVAVLVLRMALVIRNSYRMIRNSQPIADPQRLSVLHQLKEIAGIKRPVRWVQGDWVKTPIAFGIAHPLIAIPANLFEKFSMNQIRWILLHELAHIQRGDGVVAYGQRIVQILFFMHPAVWWTNILIDQQWEYACDDAALAGSQSSPVECGEGFLGVVMQSHGLPPFLPATQGLINYKTMIRRRLMRILDDTKLFQPTLSIPSKMVLAIFTLFVFPLSMNDAIAQIGQWELTATDGPQPRSAGVMVYDSARDRIVLYGGVDSNNTRLSDSWEYDGKKWTNVAPHGLTPGPKQFHCMAYDENRKTVILFGGWDANNNTDSSIWEHDGMQWSKLSAEGPAARIGAAMVYDSNRMRVILHGGEIQRMVNFWVIPGLGMDLNGLSYRTRVHKPIII